MVEQPRRPAHAYACFMAAKRAELFKQVPDGAKAVPWVGKKGGELWGAMSGEDRAPYEKRAADLKKAFETEMEKFKAQGGVVTKKRKGDGNDGTGKRQKMPKDENRPKRPIGGAWGVFLNDSRARIMRELPQGFQATDIGKEASGRWKALDEAQRRPYQQKYEQLMQAYQQAMTDYKPPAAAEEAEDEEDESREGEE